MLRSKDLAKTVSIIVAALFLGGKCFATEGDKIPPCTNYSMYELVGDLAKAEYKLQAILAKTPIKADLAGEVFATIIKIRQKQTDLVANCYKSNEGGLLPGVSSRRNEHPQPVAAHPTMYSSSKAGLAGGYQTCSSVNGKVISTVCSSNSGLWTVIYNDGSHSDFVDVSGMPLEPIK